MGTVSTIYTQVVASVFVLLLIAGMLVSIAAY
jgi:hypothetical protein